MNAEMVRAGFVQTVPRFGDPEGNLRRARGAVMEAPPFDVLVLPELFASGYVFRDRAELESFAEPVDGATVRAVTDWARERHGWIVAGFPERAGARVFNSAVLAGPDGTVHVYRKVHLFDRETTMFDPGDRPFETWDVDTGAGRVRVGAMVCFDWVFPEAARSLALQGAELIVHPSNLVTQYCQDAMKTRCLENGVYAVTANRAGEDDRGDARLRFTGRSQITGPRGQMIRRASRGGTSVAVEELDLGAARDKHITPRNDVLADRRPESYR
jgi:predicted amidohydrolase